MARDAELIQQARFDCQGFEILQGVNIEERKCRTVLDRLATGNFESHSSNYLEFQSGTKRNGDSVIFFLPDVAPDIIDILPLKDITQAVIAKTGIAKPYITQFTARNSTIPLAPHRDTIYPWIDKCWMAQAIVALSTNLIEETTFVYPGTHQEPNPILNKSDKHYTGLKQGEVMLIDSRTYHGAEEAIDSRWIIVITFSAQWLRPLARFKPNNEYMRLFGLNIRTPSLASSSVSVFHD